LHGTQGLGDGKFARHLCCIQPGFQFLNFGVFGDSGLLHFASRFGLRKLDGIALVLLGQFKALMQLLLERAVANLLQDICVPRLVDFECFAAVGADDFMHVGASCFC
jgi:hypothetical protein